MNDAKAVANRALAFLQELNPAIYEAANEKTKRAVDRLFEAGVAPSYTGWANFEDEHSWVYDVPDAEGRGRGLREPESSCERCDLEEVHNRYVERQYLGGIREFQYDEDPNTPDMLRNYTQDDWAVVYLGGWANSTKLWNNPMWDAYEMWFKNRQAVELHLELHLMIPTEIIKMHDIYTGRLEAWQKGQDLRRCEPKIGKITGVRSSTVVIDELSGIQEELQRGVIQRVVVQPMDLDHQVQEYARHLGMPLSQALQTVENAMFEWAAATEGDNQTPEDSSTDYTGRGPTADD